MNLLKKMNSKEEKDNVNFLQENVYLDTESCLMSLCNILKDAAQDMKKASTLKTGKSKFRSGWYDHECYTYKKKAQRSLRRYQNWRSAVRKAEDIQNRKSYKKKLLKEKKEAYSSHKISTLFKSLNNPTLFWKEVRSLNPNRRTINSVDLNEWYSYFVNIFQAQKPVPPYLR